MYLAYRSTTPNELNAAFHWLAANDIAGPSLPCNMNDIPVTMQIVEPSEHVCAVQRLKNYSPEEFDQDKFDGHLNCTDHEPSEYESEEEKLLSNFSYTSGAEKLFEESICESAVASAQVDTRSALGHLWHELCSKLDESSNPERTAELANFLKRSISSVDAEIRAKNNAKPAAKKRKAGGIVPLNPSVYEGPGRVYCTNNM